MTRDNPRAKQITEVLTQCIVLDDQPLSVIDNVGFCHLVNVLEAKYKIPSHRHVTDIVLPQIHVAVKKHVMSMLHDIKAISFTTDIWSCSVNPVSLISLTAQWIDGDFTLQQIMLHAQQFWCSDTGRAIASVFEEILATWAIPKSSVHVVVRDNAKNMVKGMEEAGVSSLPCGTYSAAGRHRGSAVTAQRYGGCGSGAQNCRPL